MAEPLHVPKLEAERIRGMADYAVDGGKPVDTTSVHNEKFRTRTPATCDDFDNSADAFNRLALVPECPIDLKDGRRLNITEWAPTGTEETMSGVLRITVRGFITLSKEPMP